MKTISCKSTELISIQLTMQPFPFSWATFRSKLQRMKFVFLVFLWRKTNFAVLQVRKFFEDCGEIKNVRLIRDGKTGIGKGFGYVNFHSKDSVVLALQKDGQSLNGRDLRVQSTNYSNKNDKNNPKGSIKKDMRPSNADSFKKEKPNGQFSGEKANKKKFAKKSLKNKVKSNKIKKQGKKVAEILSK